MTANSSRSLSYVSPQLRWKLIFSTWSLWENRDSSWFNNELPIFGRATELQGRERREGKNRGRREGKNSEKGSRKLHLGTAGRKLFQSWGKSDAALA